jgi:hypothetical protein
MKVPVGPDAGPLAGQRLDPGCAARTVKLNKIAGARDSQTENDMKEMILENKCKPGHARGRRGRTAALLGGLVVALTLPGTGLKSQVLDTSKSVLLSWPEPAQEQIVVGSDSLASNAVWTPWPEPIFKRFGQMCMAVPTTASQQFFRTALGRQFVDEFSDTWGPFTNRCPWTSWIYNPTGDEWMVTNGVLQVNFRARPFPGFALIPLGTNAAGELRDFYASVDLFDWVTSGTNSSVFALAGRGHIYGPTSATAYFGGVSVNGDGIGGSVQPWIFDGYGYVYGQPFDSQQIPPPYRVQFSVVGTNLSLRVLNPTTGQVIREVSGNSAKYSQGFVGLWINGRNIAGDWFTMTADNFLMSGTKP